MTFDLFAAPQMRQRRFTRRAHRNPFYPGAATIVVTDTTTGRWRSFQVWANTTAGDARRLAWHHVRALHLLSVSPPDEPMPRRPQFRFSRDSGLNGGRWTE